MVGQLARAGKAVAGLELGPGLAHIHPRISSQEVFQTFLNTKIT